LTWASVLHFRNCMMRSFLVHQGRLDNGLLVRIPCHFGGIGTTRAIASTSTSSSTITSTSSSAGWTTAPNNHTRHGRGEQSIGRLFAARSLVVQFDSGPGQVFHHGRCASLANLKISCPDTYTTSTSSLAKLNLLVPTLILLVTKIRTIGLVKSTLNWTIFRIKKSSPPSDHLLERHTKVGRSRSGTDRSRTRPQSNF
jgi:hypothetical protein